MFICRQKNIFIHHAFVEILRRYTNLLWVLWTWLLGHTQDESINLQKTSMFICMSKINFSIHFFLEILSFKESCNLICWQNFGPQLEYSEIFQIWDWPQNINNNISFHFRSFPKKSNVEKCKKPYSEVILLYFCPNLDKNEFSWEKGLCQFLNIPVDYNCAKYQKKLMGNSWEKCLNDGTDKQTGNFIVFSVGQGSNYQSNFKLFWIYINTPKTSLFH